VVEGIDTPIPTPTLPSGLVLPSAETDILPTAPLEPTPINTPVVPPTGTPSTTPAPTNTTLPAAAEGEGTPPAPPTFQEAQVLEVIDGDTIRVSLDGTEYTVDYLLIDTPETTEPAQIFGPEAADFNRVLLEGKTVRLEEDASLTGPDGHLLRYVWFSELLVNEEILRQGLAKVVPSPTDLRHLERFLAVQSEAQAAGIGLWSSAANPPTPPPLVDETPDGSNSEHNADLGN
jgi:micrococcal nuclease